MQIPDELNVGDIQLELSKVKDIQLELSKVKDISKDLLNLDDQVIEECHIPTKSVQLNNKYILFFDEHKIYYKEIKESYANKKKLQMGFELDKEDQNQIKEIACGTNNELICIICEGNPETDTLYIWNIENDCCEGFYDIGLDYDIIWDLKGNPYVNTQGKIINVHQECIIKAFGLDQNDCQNSNSKIN